MRLTSMFFALLLAPLTLAAQTATADSSPAPQVDVPSVAVQTQLRNASACPVGFTVDRVATGAIIWTNGESDWFNAHSNLSLPELERALQAEPGFGQLSAEDQQHRLDQLAHLYHSRHGQGLDITFFRRAPRIVSAPAGENRGAPQIISADITVHGYPLAAHIIPATPSLPAEVTETFHLAAGSGAPLLRSSLWTEHMVVINSVELTRVEYADGVTWQASAPRQCSVSPSLYLPVASAGR